MTPRPVTFFSDGFRLAADYYCGEHAPGAKRPGVVLCHGYTGTRRIHLPEFAAALAGAGYAVLVFDYRGWGDSEGPRTRLAPFTRVADVQAAVTWLSVQAEVDPDRLALYGTSYGGAVAIWATALDPRVRCLIAAIAVGNGARWMRSVRRPDEYADLLVRAAADRIIRVTTGTSDMVARDEVLLPDRQSLELGNAARRNNPAAVTEVPLSFVDDTLGFNAEWVVGQIAPRPILFITTDNDRLVPPEETFALHASAGEPKRLVVLHGYGHYQLYSGDALAKTVAATLDWFGNWLNGTPHLAPGPEESAHF